MVRKHCAAELYTAGVHGLCSAACSVDQQDALVSASSHHARTLDPLQRLTSMKMIATALLAETYIKPTEPLFKLFGASRFAWRKQFKQKRR